ncbi:MAG: hypothetical protein ACXVEF_19435 [Polyangiales bacterium]
MRAVLPWISAVFATALFARADDSTTLRLEYSAPPSCPGEITFRTQVTGRTSHVAFGPQGKTLVVRITRAAGQFVGRASGAVEKEVRATTCDEVVAALAIVTSLAFEPASTSTSTSTSPSPSPSPSPSTSTSTSPGTPPPVVALGATIGVVRDFGLDYGGFIEGRSGEAAFRLGVVRATRSIDAPLGGTLDLGLTTGRASICPIAIAFLSPCLAGEVGALVGKPQGIPGGATARRTWAALDLALRAAWSPFAPVFLELEGFVGTPLTRDRFVIEPAEEVFRAAPVRFGATLALGVRGP